MAQVPVVTNARVAFWPTRGGAPVEAPQAFDDAEDVLDASTYAGVGAIGQALESLGHAALALAFVGSG